MPSEDNRFFPQYFKIKIKNITTDKTIMAKCFEWCKVSWIIFTRTNNLRSIFTTQPILRIDCIPYTSGRQINWQSSSISGKRFREHLFVSKSFPPSCLVVPPNSKVECHSIMSPKHSHQNAHRPVTHTSRLPQIHILSVEFLLRNTHTQTHHQFPSAAAGDLDVTEPKLQLVSIREPDNVGIRCVFLVFAIT